MSADCSCYQPNWDDEERIPYCSGDSCCQFDGKRCRLWGFRTQSICVPAVEDMTNYLYEHDVDFTDEVFRGCRTHMRRGE
jgi:hypothetical protein